MDIVYDIRIRIAERLNDGLVITFTDGRCAFYSALLLSFLFMQADQLDPTAIAW